VTEIVLRAGDAGDAGAVLAILKKGLMAANFENLEKLSVAELDVYRFFQALKPTDRQVFLGIVNALRCDEVRMRLTAGDRFDVEFIEDVDEEAVLATVEHWRRST
tara:strand:+ start:252 stop:566 length:315 start_codon:yes stop_codon:yes gene_type:complete